MPQKNHWHPKMMWYGPCGIGTTRGLQGFVDYHQLPFRIAFPNRRGGNHYVRIGDGPYSATAGWPSVHAKHLGGDFLDVAPTGRDVTMRVMDFYLHHEGLDPRKLGSASTSSTCSSRWMSMYSTACAVFSGAEGLLSLIEITAAGGAPSHAPPVVPERLRLCGGPSACRSGTAEYRWSP